MTSFTKCLQTSFTLPRERGSKTFEQFSFPFAKSTKGGAPHSVYGMHLHAVAERMGHPPRTTCYGRDESPTAKAWGSFRGDVLFPAGFDAIGDRALQSCTPPHNRGEGHYLRREEEELVVMRRFITSDNAKHRPPRRTRPERGHLLTPAKRPSRRPEQTTAAS